jgi:hypothetical protein
MIAERAAEFLKNPTALGVAAPGAERPQTSTLV